MPDITMCFGINRNNVGAPHAECPLRDNCYRFTAPRSEFRQSYFTEAPFIIEPDGTSCKYFWRDKE